MSSITVTQATLSDLPILTRISRKTFIEAFAESNVQANLNQYVAEKLNAQILETELKNSGSLFFIARDEGEAIGYLKLNTGTAQTEPFGEPAIEIERIYVTQAYLGRKIGQLLCEKAIAVAREQNKAYIWLGVWEHNVRAIRFYEKNGFEAFSTHSFMMGEEEQTDLLMKKNFS